MVRPKDKDSLIKLANENFEKLLTQIESFSDEQKLQNFPSEERDQNIRDVLAHLSAWQKLFISWTDKNKKGEAASFLPAPYNWKTYPQMNIEIWKDSQKTSFADILAEFKKNHKMIMKQIDGFTDEELFVKKYFPWTGSTNLGSYAISATSSHYDWAMKKLKNFKKIMGN